MHQIAQFQVQKCKSSLPLDTPLPHPPSHTLPPSVASRPRAWSLRSLAILCTQFSDFLMLAGMHNGTYIVYLKTPGSAWPGKRVHWGQTPFWVKDDPEIGQLSADLTNNGGRLTQLWVTFCVKLTDFWVIIDPEWSLAPMDPSRVNFWPGCF